jgi:hypothetical protein
MDPAKVIIQPQPKPPEPVKVSIGSAEDIINPVMLATLMRTAKRRRRRTLPPRSSCCKPRWRRPCRFCPRSAPDSGPPQDPAKPGISNADWQEQPRINKRDQDGGA